MACAPGPDNRFTPGDGEPGGGADDAVLARFAADARIEERLAERRRQRWLEQQAAESSTFAGLVRNLAEAATPVRLRTAAGTVHRGPIAVIGEDAIGVRTAKAQLTLVALTHLAALDTPGTTVISGDREPEPPGPQLGHLLADLADAETVLHGVLVGGDRFEGRLRWVGEDVLALDGASGPDEPGPTGRYVRLSSVIEVSVSVSG
jgi:hypothetical protein